MLDEPADGYDDGRHVHMTCYTAEHTGSPAPGREIAEARRLTSADRELCPPAGQRVLGQPHAAGLID